MPRGVPLTPEQTATIVRVFAETGSYSEAGRAVDVPPNTARDVVTRLADANRRKLHARACDRAVREARASLRRTAARVEGYVVTQLATDSLEPRDLAALYTSLARGSDALLAIREAESKRRTGRATRDKTRAETELARARLRVLTDWDVVLAHATEPERAALDAIRRAAEARAARRADLAAEPEREPGGA